MKIVIMSIVLSLLGVPATQAETTFTIPDGFELQVLDVTEGHIAKPKGWYYNYGGDKSKIVWTISKEDSNLGPYKTGLRIQFAPKVSSAARMTPQAFAEKFITDRKKSGKVVRDCPPQPDGDFLRACIETLETEDQEIFHILYSVLWSNEKDALVVTIFGSPEAEWETNRLIADQMAHFELLGEGFWLKKKAPNQKDAPDPRTDR